MHFVAGVNPASRIVRKSGQNAHFVATPYQLASEWKAFEGGLRGAELSVEQNAQTVRVLLGNDGVGVEELTLPHHPVHVAYIAENYPHYLFGNIWHVVIFD